MSNRQFYFSLSVGVALMALGLIILKVATVGFSLIALGAAIGALALLTRNAQAAPGKAQTVSATDQQFRSSAVEH